MSSVYSSLCRVCSNVRMYSLYTVLYLHDYVLCTAMYVHQSICMVCNNVRKYIICMYDIQQCTYIDAYVWYTTICMYVVQHVRTR